MVSFRATVVALVAVPFVSAMIGGVEPYVGTYAPTNVSTFPVTFTSSYTKVTYFDLTVSFGLITPTDLATSQNNSIGMPVKKNLDLIALNKTYIGEATTFNIPLPASDFYAGPGDYILTALVTGANGVVPTLIPFNYKLRIPFKAVF